MNKEFLKRFGENVRDRRKRANLTQEDLSIAMGMTRVQLCNIEIGNSGTSIEKLANLCAILKCTPNDLLPASNAQHVEYPIYFNIY